MRLCRNRFGAFAYMPVHIGDGVFKFIQTLQHLFGTLEVCIKLSQFLFLPSDFRCAVFG